MNTSSPNMWPRVTEHAARHSFASKNHELEMKGFDKYKELYPEFIYNYPDGQNSHVDLLQGETRLQFKTVSPNTAGKAGFNCGLNTSGGRRGKKRDPYHLQNCC